MNARVRLGTRTAGLRSRERGIALITSLLLLLIITILGLSMFRGLGSQEKIAGNLREKDRALHAAESAQQYAEWWLLQGNNAAIGAVTCSPGQNANLGQGQICNQRLTVAAGFAPPPAPYTAGDVPLPWNLATVFTPPNMSTIAANQTGSSGDPPYFDSPRFYIADLGLAHDGAGEAYQIDAYGYGGSSTTVAVVESTYEVAQGVVNRGGL